MRIYNPINITGIPGIIANIGFFAAVAIYIIGPWKVFDLWEFYVNHIMPKKK